LHERGAVLRLSVWDADLMDDDFIGECFVPLPNIAPLTNLASIRDVPVTEVRLRQPYKCAQPRVFGVRTIDVRVCSTSVTFTFVLQLIRNRAAFDEQAAQFVKQRTAIMRSGNGSDGASVASDDRHSSGSYASAALRSLLCMLPFNIGYGHQSATQSRSDIIHDDELV
jgi:hypothetical protein